MTRLWDEISNGIACIITPPQWAAEVALTMIDRERVTVGQGVATQWELMLRHDRFAQTDFSPMRIAAMGASSIPADLVRRVRRLIGCPVVVRYTSTEACITTSTSPDDPPEVVATTVGKPVPGVKVELVDENGQPVPPGSVGQLRCRSAAVMKGYWLDPDATASVLDSGGWLSTGDLAYVDTDDNLHITGRLKDMYIRGGYNVYPIQVEDVLREHPLIADVAVLGVPDPVLGETGLAFVVSAGPEPLTLSALRDWMANRLADYKRPDRLEILAEIPRSAMGKIDRRALAERAQTAMAAHR
jgi:acyl-CoA synthetase (AMP-forming)/AMP-acid ligase II